MIGRPNFGRSFPPARTLFGRESRQTVVDQADDHGWYRQVANSPRTGPESASVKPFALALTPGSSSKISQL